MTSLFWMVLKLTALLFWKVSYWRIFCESYILSTQRQNIDQFFPCSFLQRAWGNIKANQWIYWIYIYQPRGTSILLKKKKNQSLSCQHVKNGTLTECKEELTCEDWGLFQLTGTRTLFAVDPEEVEEVLRVTSVVLLLTSWPAARCSSS